MHFVSAKHAKDCEGPTLSASGRQMSHQEMQESSFIPNVLIQDYDKCAFS